VLRPIFFFLRITPPFFFVRGQDLSIFLFPLSELCQKRFWYQQTQAVTREPPLGKNSSSGPLLPPGPLSTKSYSVPLLRGSPFFPPSLHPQPLVSILSRGWSSFSLGGAGIHPCPPRPFPTFLLFRLKSKGPPPSRLFSVMPDDGNLARCFSADLRFSPLFLFYLREQLVSPYLRSSPKTFFRLSVGRRRFPPYLFLRFFFFFFLDAKAAWARRASWKVGRGLFPNKSAHGLSFPGRVLFFFPFLGSAEKH